MKNIVLTYGDVRNPVFTETVQRMINAKLPFPVTIKLLSLAKLVNEERTLANTLVDKLIKEHSDPVKEGGKQDLYKVRDAELETFNKSVDELDSTTFQTRLEKIEPAMLSKMELTVNELLAISSLLVGGEELQALSTDAPKKEAPAEIAEAPKPVEASP